MAKICCSIELEPKTLSQTQLNQAREVAAEVVQKLEPSEASSIFIEGLRPLDPTKEIIKQMDEDNEGKDEKHFEINEGAKIVDDKACQCLCTTAAIDQSPDQFNLKEPFSAPF
ncbi:Mannose-6-phosphate isomerase [Quillaja saponaria]|uniref:Mannose-6-phosphate isomerase n=1 Tax=Quillaja saponaria TaxID=32244 RepID=A0AAD7PPF6_QUISA|nr:Mannose-6-phosphate isomerase [Quillaja saponaria]